MKEGNSLTFETKLHTSHFPMAEVRPDNEILKELRFCSIKDLITLAFPDTCFVWCFPLVCKFFSNWISSDGEWRCWFKIEQLGAGRIIRVVFLLQQFASCFLTAKIISCPCTSVSYFSKGVPVVSGVFLASWTHAGSVKLLLYLSLNCLLWLARVPRWEFLALWWDL